MGRKRALWNGDGMAMEWRLLAGFGRADRGGGTGAGEQEQGQAGDGFGAEFLALAMEGKAALNPAGHDLGDRSCVLPSVGWQPCAAGGTAVDGGRSRRG